jgi:acyl carrier protein
MKRFIVMRPDADTADVVFRTIAQFLPGERVLLSSRLVDDLRLPSDDLSELASMLEKTFQVSPSRAAYKAVDTVGKLVDLFDRMRRQRGRNEN